MSDEQRAVVENLSIDVRLLHYFSKAYELGSFAKASDALYISRQALRYGIKSIEEILGCELFLTQGNRIVPTREGNTLYRLSRKTLAAYDEMEMALVEELINRRRKKRNGQVAGVHELMTGAQLDQRREEFKTKPHVFITGSCDSLRQKLREGKLDAICMITDSPKDDEFDFEMTRSGQLYLMVYKDHPYATRTAVSIRDLCNQRFVSQGDEFDLHGMLARLCHEAGFELNVVYTGLDFFELAGQVNDNAGLSYALFPHGNHFDDSQIVFVPFDPPLPWYVLQLSRKH